MKSKDLFVDIQFFFSKAREPLCSSEGFNSLNCFLPFQVRPVDLG